MSYAVFTIRADGVIEIDLGDRWPGFNEALADAVTTRAQRGSDGVNPSTYWIDRVLAALEQPADGEHALASGNDTDLARIGDQVVAKSQYELFADEAMPLAEFISVLELWRAKVEEALASSAGAPFGPTKHCCNVMRGKVEHRCDQDPDPYDCPDNLISYLPAFREYGLIIHDGGTSSVAISYCPWCGEMLPLSERMRWFAELERLGIDPSEDELPPGFADGAWLEAMGPRPPEEGDDLTGGRSIAPWLTG